MTRPTLADLIRHAERFGIVGVYETAAGYLAPRELARLAIELDAIEAAKRNSRQARRRRRSHAEQVEAARLLAAEGMGPDEVAAKLGITAGHARKLVREALRARLTHPEGATRPGSPVPSLGPNPVRADEAQLRIEETA